jgi:phosphoglycolate phosphatase-like HAD superfamily hydrolase
MSTTINALLLLLFDIDGTLLIQASREHVAAMHAALRDVHGITRPARVEAAGRTDVEIARHISLLADIPAVEFDRRLDDLIEAMIANYATLVPEDLSDRVAPGVPALLAELGTREDVVLSLVTGNVEPVARLKLGAAGIGHHFPSGQGGFGSDHEDRTLLPPIARARAGAGQGGREPYPRERTVVIGDTPRDIACAQADGLRCIAVTTGSYPAEELGAADVVVAGASEVLAAIDSLE